MFRAMCQNFFSSFVELISCFGILTFLYVNDIISLGEKCFGIREMQ